MRITQHITYNTYINDLMRKQESIYDLHRQLSTGKRVNTPSDDPVKTDDILSTKSLISDMGQYERNIDDGLSYLSIVEQSLDSAKDVITTLQEHAVTQASGTNDAQTRANTAVVVNNLFKQLVSLSNTAYDNKYVFAGYKVETEAFDSTGAFQGDSSKRGIRTGANTTVEIGVNGGEVFSGSSGGVDIFQIIADFETALNANDTTGIASAIDTLDEAFNQISNAVSDIGGKVSRLTQTKDSITHSMLELKTTVSGLEDADLTSVISDLKLSQIALEAAMQSAGKVFSVNIFDYV
ncbi:MAG: flagellar hook-associated protein FlgL [Deltaproteobacteria bacterium]